MNTSFWLMPLIGGLLIGLAATLFLLLNGQIAGISNIVGSLLPPWRDRSATPAPNGSLETGNARLANAAPPFRLRGRRDAGAVGNMDFGVERLFRRGLFVLGLLAGGATLSVFHPEAFGPAQSSLSQLAFAGFLVGFGARIGNGCTSGHGVCGLSRRSLRSLVATPVFMAAAMASVYLARHVIG